MKDVIYLPLMAISNPDWLDVPEYLVGEIASFSPPDGVLITSVRCEEDGVIQHLFHQVMKLNPDPDDSISMSPECLLIIEVESQERISCTRQPWLEEQLKEVIRNFDYSTGNYFFYLVDEGRRFEAFNIAKVIKEDETVVLENDTTDDFSPLLSAADFLNSFWYRPGGLTVEDTHPAETALYCLILED